MALARSPLAAAGRSLFATSGGEKVSSLGGEGLEELHREIGSLEAKLRHELRPDVASADSALAELRARELGLQATIAALGKGRTDAAEQLGESLTKRHLAEIRQLTRSPPEVAKRTLAACWLLLHSDRFKGRPASAISFDETKEWAKCQRMLADDGFVGLILSFDVACFDLSPGVLEHVAATYFGLCPTLADGRVVAVAEGPVSRKSSDSLRPGTKGSPCLRKRTLEVEAVARASVPCGSLVRWMRELVVEYTEHSRLTSELAVVRGGLDGAIERCASSKRQVAETEAALLAARAALRAREQASKEEQPKKISVVTSLPKIVVEAAELPKVKPKVVKPQKVEVEVRGTLAIVEQQVARLRVNFEKHEVAIAEGNSQQDLTLQKLATVLKEHRGGLKLLLEGHQVLGERDGTDIGRSLAVYQWLVTIAGCPPGLLRIKGLGASRGEGHCVVPVPIQELVARISGDAPNNPSIIGIHFEDSRGELGADVRAILPEMAKCLVEDEYTVRVEGHTDGNERDDLALLRANGVCDALVQLGVSRLQLKSTACKSLHPLSRLQAGQNRRVEVHLD